MKRVMMLVGGLVALATCGYAGTPPLPVINTNVILDVTNSVFVGGALGNGVSNCAAAIQAAISAATATNVGGIAGGTVRIPAAGTLSTYLSGPINLASHVNLQVDAGATLKMLPYATWPGTTTFINAGTLTDVEISGTGTIDGNAGFTVGNSTNWWQSSGTQLSRPNFIQLIHCTRSLIKDVTLQNPPTFHLMLKNNSVSMTIQNIKINTPSNSPNTDGMDLGSSNVLIYGCSISDGDDNIQIGSSSAVCSDITITNCTFGSGHGLSIGSPTQSGINNLIVSNCTFNGTEYGIHGKSDRDIGGIVENLRYLDITMANVTFPIAFYSYYHELGTPSTTINVSPFMASTDVTHSATVPVWRNITISNVTATSVGGNIAGILWGLPEVLISNVTLAKVNFTAPAKTFCIYNATGIRIVDSNLTAPNTTTNTLTIYNAQVTVTNTIAGTNLFTIGGLAKPPTNNVLSFFNGRALITDTNVDGAGLFTLGGSTLTFSQTTVTFSNNINAISASTLVVSNGTAAIRGALTGPGPLSVILTNTGGLRFNQGANAWGGSNTIFNAGSAGTINNSAPGNISISMGALTGSSGAKLRGSDQAGAGLDTYVIGYLNSNTTFAGVISNSATHTVALTKIGSGAFTVTGTNTYTGGTTVSNGTLVVHGIIPGAVTIVSGATLGGAGTINGSVTVNGALAPGASPGKLTISSNLVVAGVLQYELGTNSDLTVVSSDLTLGGSLNITDAGGFTNSTYTLFTYGGALTFNGLTVGNVPTTNFTYVVNTNTLGQVRLFVSVPTQYPQWQLQYFGCTNNGSLCAQAADAADPDIDGQNNLTEFLAGTDPTNSASFWRFQASPTNGLPPLVVNFTENSTGSSISNRVWDFGDGASGSGSNPSHTYTNAGTFTVGVTILNVFGTATLVTSNLITVLPEAVWTNANASGNWSASTSWSPLSTPDSGADVIFATAGTTAVVDSVSRTVGDIAFNRSGNFAIAASGGASLAIKSGITVANPFTYTISAPVLLSGTNIWLVASNGVLQLSGPISGTNSVTKDGGGTAVLSGTNSYSGATIISNGTLAIVGAGLITNTPSIALAMNATLDVSGRTGGNMALAAGQTMQGNGSILGKLILANGSTLSPGDNSAGTLTFLNDLVASNAAVWQYDLGTNSDVAAVASNLTLGGTLNINDNGGFATGVYTLVMYGGVLTDNGLTIGATPNTNLLYTIDTNTAGIVKLNVTLLPTTVAVGAANLQDSSGNLAPSNSVAVLVVDTGNNGFAAPQPAFALSLGASWGTDDQVVGVWDLRDSINCTGTNGGALCAQTVVADTNGIAPGQSLQLYWFPSLTLSSNILGVTSYGKYTDPVGMDSSDVWQLPGSGGSLNLLFITALQGGSNPESAGQAVFSTASVAPSANFTVSATNGVEPLAVTFTDISTGTPPLQVSWDLGDSSTTNTAGGASFTHPYAAGVYTVTLTASNSAGTSTLVSNNLITVISAFQSWQLQYFSCTNCPQAAGNFDADGDGVSNTNEFLAGTNPTNAASAFRIIATTLQATNVVIMWTTAGGRTNVVQATTGDVNGGYGTNYADISGQIIVPGSGDVTTNYTDSGGATNSPSRYYRVRLLP